MIKITEEQRKVLNDIGIEAGEPDDGDAISLSVTGRRTAIEIFYYIGAERQPLETVLQSAIEEFAPRYIAMDLISEFKETNPYDIVLDIIDAGIALRNALSELNGNKPEGIDMNDLPRITAGIKAGYNTMSALASENRPDVEEYADAFDAQFNEAEDTINGSILALENIAKTLYPISIEF